MQKFSIAIFENENFSLAKERKNVSVYFALLPLSRDKKKERKNNYTFNAVFKTLSQNEMKLHHFNRCIDAY